MKSAIKITAIYALVSSLWILLSDRAVETISESPGLMVYYSTIKGLFFVLITGTMLFFLISREERSRDRIIRELDKGVEVRSQLIQELHHRIKNNIQAVLGLIRIDSRKKTAGEEAAGDIEQKLLSMLSVYNVVYDYGDMNSISFGNVLREYSVLSSRPFTVTGDENSRATIETMVTVLLVIESILEKIRQRGIRGDMRVEISPENIILVFNTDLGDLNTLLGDDRNYVELYIKSVKGNIEIPSDDACRIVLHYQNRETSNLKG